MLEKSRQFVIFGNFNGITFSEISKFDDIMRKYSLTISAQPDVPSHSSKQPFIISSGREQIRPVLIGKDDQSNVFLGSSRIHIEQLNCDSATYDSFIKMAKDIYEQICSIFSISINRFALNGQFLCNQKDKMQEQFSLAFKDSKLYNDSSQEWQYRINTIQKNVDLQCDVNNIVAASILRQPSSNGESDVVLIKGYDYNTIIDNSRIFQFTDIDVFLKSALLYREEVLAELE